MHDQLQMIYSLFSVFRDTDECSSIGFVSLDESRRDILFHHIILITSLKATHVVVDDSHPSYYFRHHIDQFQYAIFSYRIIYSNMHKEICGNISLIFFPSVFIRLLLFTMKKKTFIFQCAHDENGFHSMNDIILSPSLSFYHQMIFFPEC